MIAAIKSEFRKLFTVRSTYLILGLVLFMLMMFAFYIGGYRADPAAGLDPGHLARDVTDAITATAVLVSIVGLLLVTHEYRYNTIMYTLTSSNSRTRILLAKFAVISVFALVATLIIGILSPTLAYLGMHLKGTELVPQTIPVANLLWRGLFYGWAYASAAVLIAVLIRNQVGAIIIFLFGINAAEGLLSLLLKRNSVYLPFSSLYQVINTNPPPPPSENFGYLSPGKAALVFLAYLIVGWIVAWILFLRRDAN